jgi:hypothetical protein
MLSTNFYTLIGALEAAHAYITRNPPHPDTDATGDSHLDPQPGKTVDAIKMLTGIKKALLGAEAKLSTALALAQSQQVMNPDLAKATRHKGWKQFCEIVTGQSFTFATVVRRLIWMPGSVPGTGTGTPEWETMDKRLRRILKAFAEVELGGGEDNPALHGPGILGSSDESISF